MDNRFIVKTFPKANRNNIIKGKNYRITILTPSLIRFEYSKDNKFEDRATQMVWSRNFPKVDYTVSNNNNGIVIDTDNIELFYDEKMLSRKGFTITLLENGFVYNYGDKISNLLGTARTLDNTNGSNVTLENGIISRDGISILYDESGVVLNKDGWIEQRNIENIDFYVFCYGHNYLGALKDFYYLTSKTPLIPRFALGNWWSRYYEYTQKEYIELMDTFKEKNIPLSVAVIDMDWHITNVDKRFGSGWTGYTWNTDLFPDHVKFLSDLHSRGLKTTLNLHPHSGIRAFEKPYPVIAKHLGLDIENEEQVYFDVTNPNFMKYYYEDVLHPLEDEGVDFWWIDWQQGTKTKFANLDPLWMLNHYTYLDSSRRGNRNITFSRYASVGSHRYPIGFSGDTHVTWETLDFQPFFTANASNIGYGWWSHDIGGHMQGYKNNELMTRWVQFAVFSPILRLHSTKNPFNGKEPWRYGPESEKIISDYLRLRHRLIPYLYNMNYRASEECIPLLMPLYYLEPENETAYEFKNEYYFGDSLLVCPITSPRFTGSTLAKVDAYLPKGKWYDVFSNRMYTGDRKLSLYRELDKIPVFAKLGSIIPLSDSYDVNAKDKLHFNIYLGDNGKCEMYEDDGNTTKYEQGEYAKTLITLKGKERTKTTLTLNTPKGDINVLPKTRNYIFDFFSSKNMIGKVRILIDGKETKFDHTYTEDLNKNTLVLNNVSSKSEIIVSFDSCAYTSKNNLRKDIFELLDNAELRFETKNRIYNAAFTNKNDWGVFNEISRIDCPYHLLCAVMEILKSNEEDTSYLIKE